MITLCMSQINGAPTPSESDVGVTEEGENVMIPIIDDSVSASVSASGSGSGSVSGASGSGSNSSSSGSSNNLRTAWVMIQRSQIWVTR